MAKVKLQNVRLAFPSLWEPTAVGDSEAKAYGARFILDPKANAADVKNIEDAIALVAKDKWGAKADAILKKLQSDGKITFSKDEYVNKNGDVYDGFEDMYHIGGRTPEEKEAPTIVSKKGFRVKQGEEGAPYSGCYVIAILDIWAQDNQYGRRINASLSGVQFFRDGAAFGGGRPASLDEFEDLSDTGEDDDADLG
jgi:hypothetical protein